MRSTGALHEERETGARGTIPLTRKLTTCILVVAGKHRLRKGENRVT